MILKIKSKLVGLEKIVLPLVLFLSLGGCQSQPAGVSGNSKPVWSVAFSPQGGCTELVVDTLTKAKTEVLVQAYSFTSAPIARALIEAKNRGVKVEVILDKSQRTERYSEADFLAHSGIPVSIDAVHSIAHNKVMVIDDETVITGSFNFTKAAEEHNAENLLVFHDKELAALYKRNWQKPKPIQNLMGDDKECRLPVIPLQASAVVGPVENGLALFSAATEISPAAMLL